MKKSVRIVSLLLVVCLLSVLLVSCGKLSGTYKSDELLSVYTSYTFSGSDVTIALGALSGEISYKGTYTIDGDKITFSFGDAAASKYSKTCSYSKDGSVITIDGVKYTKQ